MEETELQVRQPGIKATTTNNSQRSNRATPYYPHGARLAIITAGLVLSIFAAALDNTIIATVIPRITTEFGSIGNIAWYGSAFNITMAAFRSTWGKAFKYFPLKPTFISTIAIFELGNAICATASSSNMLIFGRVVAGIGAGGILTGAFILIAVLVKQDHRAVYMSVMGLTFAFSSGVGPLIGGALTDSVAWRHCFWLNLPVGVLSAAIVFFTFNASLPRIDTTLWNRIINMDLGGAALVTGCLTCFVLAMHWGGTGPWSQWKAVLSLCGFAVFFVAFVGNSWCMADKSMVEPHLLKNRRISINLAYLFCSSGILFPLQFILPVQFQSFNGTSATRSGILLIPLVLGVSVFTTLAGFVLTYWRHYKPFFLVGAILATGGAAWIRIMPTHASTGAWVGAELLTGIGLGLAFQIPVIANQAAVGQHDLASTTALTLFVGNLGTTLFVASSEAAFTKSLLREVKHNLPGLDQGKLLQVGATEIRNVFSGNELEQVLCSYLNGCRTSHIIPLSCGIAITCISMIMAIWLRAGFSGVQKKTRAHPRGS